MKPMNANELLAGLALARPVPITAVVTDSRKVQPGCIFVCFPGERVDGHDYAAKAYQAGAEYVIANHPVEGVPEDHLVICESSYLAHDPYGIQLPHAVQPADDRCDRQRGQNHHQRVLLCGSFGFWQYLKNRGQPEQ